MFIFIVEINLILEQLNVLWLDIFLLKGSFVLKSLHEKDLCKSLHHFLWKYLVLWKVLSLEGDSEWRLDFGLQSLLLKPNTKPIPPCGSIMPLTWEDLNPEGDVEKQNGKINCLFQEAKIKVLGEFHFRSTKSRNQW